MLAILILTCAGCRPSVDDLLAEAERAEKDLGEWGGEVGFREPDGPEHQLIDDNSRGIFRMPFGVIAITGLAHLGDNHGSVYMLSRDIDGRVTASKTLTLPGWPCEVAASHAEIMLRVFRGHEAATNATAKPRCDCYSLQSPNDAALTSCPTVIPDGRFQ